MLWEIICFISLMNYLGNTHLMIAALKGMSVPDLVERQRGLLPRVLTLENILYNQA